MDAGRRRTTDKLVSDKLRLTKVSGANKNMFPSNRKDKLVQLWLDCGDQCLVEAHKILNNLFRQPGLFNVHLVEYLPIPIGKTGIIYK